MTGALLDMAIIVPILRILFAFQNIFDTFKTLKTPPPSARNGGKPTVRALSSRKRAMKGCMTVWLVWVRNMLDFQSIFSSSSAVLLYGV